MKDSVWSQAPVSQQFQRRTKRSLARSSFCPLSRVVVPSTIRVPRPRKPACGASFEAPSVPFAFRSGSSKLESHDPSQVRLRYTTGTRRVSSHEPEVRSAPASGMRPTFVLLALTLGAQT
eukprot:1545993-Prymnesium_polylepis.4